MKIISSISFLIISIALFFFFINPTFSEVKQLRADVDTYNMALDNSTDLQKTRDSLVDIYKNIKAEDKDRLNHLLPSSIDNIELILEIEKIANLHGMPIGDVKFDTKSLDTSSTGGKTISTTDANNNLPYGIFPMDFTIEGRYDTFILFLKDLEHNLRLVDIKSVSFSVPTQSLSGTTDPTIFNYSLKVKTYWLK